MILCFPPGFTFILPTSRSIISLSGMTATVIKYPHMMPSIFYWILAWCICAINCISLSLSPYSKKSLAYFCIQGFNTFALSCSSYIVQRCLEADCRTDLHVLTKMSVSVTASNYNESTEVHNPQCTCLRHNWAEESRIFHRPVCERFPTVTV